MKRTLAAAVSCFALLAACGDDDEKTPTPCDAFCDRAAAAACPNDDLTNCLGECNATVAVVPACSDEANAWLTCVSSAPFTCDVDGVSQPTAACDAESTALLACWGPT